MADFMVLFPAADGDDPSSFDLTEELEALLPVRFPDDRFRFAVSVASSSAISVVEIVGHDRSRRAGTAVIWSTIEAIARSRLPSPARG